MICMRTRTRTRTRNCEQTETIMRVPKRLQEPRRMSSDLTFQTEHDSKQDSPGNQLRIEQSIFNALSFSVKFIQSSNRRAHHHSALRRTLLADCAHKPRQILFWPSVCSDWPIFHVKIFEISCVVENLAFVAYGVILAGFSWISGCILV